MRLVGARLLCGIGVEVERLALLSISNLGFWLSRKPCLKKYCPTTKILAIYLEEELPFGYILKV
jgi:hypothetical protein